MGAGYRGWPLLSQLAASFDGPGQADRFWLTDHPVEETIAVSLDGVPQSTGWSYEASSHSIVFQPDALPSPGSILEIEYAIEPEECRE